MLPRDEDRIKTQLANAEAQIEREVEEFNARHPKAVQNGEEASAEEKTNSTSTETVGEPHTESPSVSNVVVDTTNISVQASRSEEITGEKQSLEEHNGEVVVENEEDTVIY